MINEITKNMYILQTISYVLFINNKSRIVRMVRIGFDAKRAAQNRTGLGNYSRFVIDILSRYYPENDYYLYVPSARKNRLVTEYRDNIKIKYPSSFWSGIPSAWRVFHLTEDLCKDKISLFHGLSNELPLNISKAVGLKSIVTIHDLIFRILPECYKPADRMIYDYKFRKACLNSDRIIAVSECTKRDIIKFYGIEPSKIDVVYQGCDEQFRHIASEDLKREAKLKFGLPDRYILFLGSIEKRKNLMLLARAVRLMADDEIKIVAVGRRTDYALEVEDFLRKNKIESRMIMLHGVGFKYLPAIYQLASVFVYPSVYEGFGIPLLEALNSRVPVIGATGSCLEEAGGPDSLYVEPDDESDLARKIDMVLFDEALRTRMIEKGIEYARNFDEKKLAGDLIAVYSKVLATDL